MKRAMLLLFVSVPLGGCGKYVSKYEKNILGKSTNALGSLANSCEASSQRLIESRLRYRSTSAPFGSECVSEIQSRTCADGKWTSWSGLFQESGCSVSDGQSCQSGDKTFQHGTFETRFRYEAETVAFGQNCRKEVQSRLCNNGKFEEWNGRLSALSCTPKPPRDCALPETVKHGEFAFRLRYKDASPAFGQKCEVEVQSSQCIDGISSAFTGTFEASSCKVQHPEACKIIADDGSVLRTIPHGNNDIKVVYQNAQVNFGEQCQSESLVGQCNNGQLKYASSRFADPVASCSVRDASPCQDTNSIEITSGTTQSRTRYANSEVSFGQACTPEVQSRTCSNGRFSDWSGVFVSPECRVKAPADCTDLLHGNIRTRLRFEHPTVNFGQECKSEPQIQSCNNGVLSGWSGTFTADKCEIVAPKFGFLVRPALTNGLSFISLSEDLDFSTFESGKEYELTAQGTFSSQVDLIAAAGAGKTGGKGGHVTGTVTFESGKVYILVIGLQGSFGGLTGAGSGGRGHGQGGSGGGFTGLFVEKISQGTTLLMAGGGGGAAKEDYRPGGDGGGLAGLGRGESSGEGGTQTTGGAPGVAGDGGQQGSALKGGDTRTDTGINDGGAGGGGYFGGGAGRGDANYAPGPYGGGGGSGFIHPLVVNGMFGLSINKEGGKARFGKGFNP